jgi:hypothetical protein
MSRCIRTAIAGVVMGFGALGALGPAKAAGFLEKSFFMFGPDYSNVLPTCEAALGTISYQFALKEGRFWNSGLAIVGWDDVREIPNTWARDTIPRRFCRAVATVSDGRAHVVKYWIGEDTSVIGVGPGVEWCVVGLDRNWAYNPRCKMAQP